MNTQSDDWDNGLTMMASKLRQDDQSGAAGFLLRARDEIAALQISNDELLAALKSLESECTTAGTTIAMRKAMQNALAVITKAEASK